MNIYRVYSPFHESSKSGTYEYGYFSDHANACSRATQVWKKLGLPENVETLPGGSLYVHDGWDSYCIYVEEIIVDKEMDSQNTGYT